MGKRRIIDSDEERKAEETGGTKGDKERVGSSDKTKIRLRLSIERSNQESPQKRKTTAQNDGKTTSQDETSGAGPTLSQEEIAEFVRMRQSSTPSLDKKLKSEDSTANTRELSKSTANQDNKGKKAIEPDLHTKEKEESDKILSSRILKRMIPPVKKKTEKLPVVQESESKTSKASKAAKGSTVERKQEKAVIKDDLTPTKPAFSDATLLAATGQTAPPPQPLETRKDEKKTTYKRDFRRSDRDSKSPVPNQDRRTYNPPGAGTNTYPAASRDSRQRASSKPFDRQQQEREQQEKEQRERIEKEKSKKEEIEQIKKDREIALKLDKIVDELIQNNDIGETLADARNRLDITDSINWTGSFLTNEQNRFDFFVTGDPKEEAEPAHPIPMFPEDLGSKQKEWPLSWWGIVEPPKDLILFQRNGCIDQSSHREEQDPSRNRFHNRISGRGAEPFRQADRVEGPVPGPSQRFNQFNHPSGGGLPHPVGRGQPSGYGAMSTNGNLPPPSGFSSRGGWAGRGGDQWGGRGGDQWGGRGGDQWGGRGGDQCGGRGGARGRRGFGAGPNHRR